jgi:hypothetical protein
MKPIRSGSRLFVAIFDTGSRGQPPVRRADTWWNVVEQGGTKRSARRSELIRLLERSRPRSHSLDSWNMPRQRCTRAWPWSASAPFDETGVFEARHAGHHFGVGVQGRKVSGCWGEPSIVVLISIVEDPRIGRPQMRVEHVGQQGVLSTIFGPSRKRQSETLRDNLWPQQSQVDAERHLVREQALSGLSFGKSSG